MRNEYLFQDKTETCTKMHNFTFTKTEIYAALRVIQSLSPLIMLWTDNGAMYVHNSVM